jgi:peroxiredoxin Q/BCP
MFSKRWLATGCAVALAGSFALPKNVAAAAVLAPVGSVAPGFTLPSQENTPVSLSDYEGKWVVLYFYSKDMSVGCSIEAHGFERDLDEYEDLNAVVLGVSLDTVGSHQEFCTKDSLSFTLLSDPNHKVVDAYGVPVESSGDIQYAQRVTFLISPYGKIVKQWQVKNIEAHSGEVLNAIRLASQR